MIFYILLALFVGIATVSTTCLADALGDLQASPGAGESNGIPAVPPPTCVESPYGCRQTPEPSQTTEPLQNNGGQDKPVQEGSPIIDNSPAPSDN